MLLRPFLNDAGSCASYLFGCTSHPMLAVVDPHVDLVEGYLEAAEALGVADRRRLRDARAGRSRVGAARRSSSGPAQPRTYLRTQVWTSRTSPLEDGQRVELGNTIVTALATPGHAPAHSAFVVADRRRGSEEPWLVFTGDSLLIGDVGRPDLHVAGDPLGQARLLHASLEKLLELPDHVVVHPSHYAGSVCGRGLSGNPFSSIGFERAHNAMLQYDDPDSFAEALVADAPPPPAHQAGIVATNRRGQALTACMTSVRLGLRANAAQFSLLVGLNALVGRDGRPRAKRPASRR